MKELFSYIVLDMLEQISYLPIGIYIGLLLYMLLSFLFKNHKKQLRLISIFLFLIPTPIPFSFNTCHNFNHANE